MAGDPRVDAYIAGAAPFAQPLLARLRQAIHAAVPGLEETLKWGMPHFTLGGRNLAGIAAFKAHIALVIHVRDDADDTADEAPDQAPGGRDGMGAYGKIRAAQDLPDDAVLTARLQDAARRLAEGKVMRAPRPARAQAELATPDDLAAALTPSARAFFDALAPSHRRDYVEWITEAKRAETRTRRVAQAAQWLAEGKRRNWKYEKR